MEFSVPSFLDTISKQFRKAIGQPVGVEDWLKTHGQQPSSLNEEPLTIAESSLVAWHRFGQNASMQRGGQGNGILRGWRMQHGEWAFSTQHRDEFEQWEIESQKKVTLDIQNIRGLSASKSNLRDYSTLDAFAQDRCQGLIERLDMDGLNHALDHQEIRILHSPKGGDSLSAYAWDGRVFLANQGGSHHFAAARYVAARLGEEVPVEGTLKTHSINPSAVTSLQQNFSMFVMEDKAESINAFEEAMRSFKAGYYWMDMPSPHQQKRALFLPKDDAQSQKVAGMLEQHGFLNLGEVFQHLLKQQAQQAHLMEPQFLREQMQKRFDALKMPTQDADPDNDITIPDPLGLRSQLKERLQQRQGQIEASPPMATTPKLS